MVRFKRAKVGKDHDVASSMEPERPARGLSAPRSSGSSQTATPPARSAAQRSAVGMSERQSALRALTATAMPLCRRGKRRGKTSSERGRAFRERQRMHEEGLERAVQQLREEVQDKAFLRGVWEAKYLRARHSLEGSLARTIHEYYQLYRHGILSRPVYPATRRLTSSELESIELQERFLRSTMDPEMVLNGQLRGPEASIQQWRLYTQAFPPLNVEIVRKPTVVGTEDDPMVVISTVVHTTITWSAINIIFPGVTADHDLLQQLLGRQMSLPCIGRYRFAEDGRIKWEHCEANFIEGLLQSGLGVDTVAKLMALSNIAPQQIIEPSSRPQVQN